MCEVNWLIVIFFRFAVIYYHQLQVHYLISVVPRHRPKKQCVHHHNLLLPEAGERGAEAADRTSKQHIQLSTFNIWTLAWVSYLVKTLWLWRLSAARNDTEVSISKVKIGWMWWDTGSHAISRYRCDAINGVMVYRFYAMCTEWDVSIGRHRADKSSWTTKHFIFVGFWFATVHHLCGIGPSHHGNWREINYL